MGSKYRNVKTMTSDNRLAASKLEAARWEQLLLLERAGVISRLTWKPRFRLFDGSVYEADSSYIENGVYIVEEVKGYETREWKLKKRLFTATYPNVTLRVVTKNDV